MDYPNAICDLAAYTFDSHILQVYKIIWKGEIGNFVMRRITDLRDRFFWQTRINNFCNTKRFSCVVEMNKTTNSKSRDYEPF